MALGKVNKFYSFKPSRRFAPPIKWGAECEKPFEMGGLTVEMEQVDGEVVFRSTFKGKTTEQRFNAEDVEGIEQYLTGLSACIDRDSEDTEAYLMRRTDYRGYAKVRTQNKI